MRMLRILRPLGAIALVVLTGSLASAGAPNELTVPEKAAGWRLLFDGKTTQGWHTFKRPSFPAQGWEVEDGWLHCLGKRGGDIVSDGEFDQFELEWEWKLARDGNSGLKYFVTETRNSALGHEYQMFDAKGEPDALGKHATASFYDVLAPGPLKCRPPGEINHSRILVRGDHVEHWLNGEKVLEYECGSPAIKAAVAASKFRNTPGFGERIKGHILLQDHTTEVWFRNIKIHPTTP